MTQSNLPAVLRTPDERFAALPDFEFAPRYLDLSVEPDGDAMRLHYLDEGPSDAAQPAFHSSKRLALGSG